MTRKPFLGLGRPRLGCLVLATEGQEAIQEIPLPNRVTFFLEHHHDSDEEFDLKVGDEVRTGQKLKLMQDDKGYAISSVTGTIAGISQYKGYLGKTYTAIAINTAEEEHWDEESKEAWEKPNAESALEFLDFLPGDPDLASLLDSEKSLDTIIIKGIDSDLLVTTNQLIVKTEFENLKAGIEYLKEITGAGKFLIAVPPELTSQAETTGAEVKVIEPTYPNTLPKVITERVLGRVVPAGKRCEEVGAGFISAEAVVSLAKAITHHQVPVNKIVTVIDKNHKSVHVMARIGTPVEDILGVLGIETQHGDGLVLGGPMTGRAIYSEDTPVMPDTDAIMVQDRSQVVMNSNSHCFNCGECVRACPAKIPINMLVRVLENGLYEEAVKEYDLLSCIECGLCSYVCPARIPVFHFIMLGKYEFDRIERMEESNA